jgi:hypothetical protein
VFYLLIRHFRQQPVFCGMLIATMLMSWVIFSQGVALFGVEQVFFPLALVVWLTFMLHQRADEPQTLPSQNESVSA